MPTTRTSDVGPLDDAIVLELDQMEKASEIDDILRYRSAAEHELQDIYEATKFHTAPSPVLDTAGSDGILMSSIKLSIHQISATLSVEMINPLKRHAIILVKKVESEEHFHEFLLEPLSDPVDLTVFIESHGVTYCPEIAQWDNWCEVKDNIKSEYRHSFMILTAKILGNYEAFKHANMTSVL
ncbi:hypothetical protein Tco_1227814 [Tanacetum coccineum]